MNVVCPTKPGDAYDLVALNKFPIVIIDDTLEDVLSSDEIREHIDTLIRNNDYLASKIKLYIREMSEEDEFTSHVLEYKSAEKSTEKETEIN